MHGFGSSAVVAYSGWRDQHHHDQLATGEAGMSGSPGFHRLFLASDHIFMRLRLSDAQTTPGYDLPQGLNDNYRWDTTQGSRRVRGSVLFSKGPDVRLQKNMVDQAGIPRAPGRAIGIVHS